MEGHRLLISNKALKTYTQMDIACANFVLSAAHLELPWQDHDVSDSST